MIWATVSSWSCFCWLYRASPSLAAKNIISLISLLAIWWCPRVKLLLCCWKRVFAMTSAFPWQNSISLCPASFCIPRPNVPVTPGVSWLPTFAFQSPIMKRMSFGVLVLEGLVGLHRTIQLHRGIGQGDHFPHHKFIKRSFECWATSTKQLLNTGRRHHAPRKPAYSLQKEVGQNIQEKKRDKRGMETCPGEGVMK